MKKLFYLILCLTLIVNTVFFYGCEKKDKNSIVNNEKLKTNTLPNEKDQFVSLDLYFNSSQDNKKVEIAKEERLIKKEELIGELIMQELIKGPFVKSDLHPILPKETRLLSFSIKDNIAYVNLSKEASFPMSPSQEEACLKSIVSSLTQLSSISKVKIQIENKDSDTLGGNFDISKPLGKDDIIARKK